MTRITPPAPLITVLGPTASGKTRLAVALAKAFSGEIISADSRQVYRGMDIGSGKDLEEYQGLPHHLINIVEPGYEYNLFEFIQDFEKAYQEIRLRHQLPFLVGGTGMYLDAILNRYQLTVASRNQQQHMELAAKTDQELYNELLRLAPEQHNSTDTQDRKRLIRAIEIARSEANKKPTLELPHVQTLTLGISLARDIARERITQRLKLRLEQGMLEEVQTLHDQGLSWAQLEFYGLEYRYIALHLKGELNFNDMFQKLNSAIHKFAKQQEKWFRKIETKGHAITWLKADDTLASRATLEIERFLQELGSN